MLDARYVADHLEEVKAQLCRRSGDLGSVVEELRELSERRRALIQTTERLQAERNQANQEMVQLKKAGQNEAFAQRRDQLKSVSLSLKQEEEKLSALELELENLLLGVPNLPADGIPDGSGDADNRVLRHWGEAPSFDFEPKAHWDLGVALGILDFERAAKLSGARFSVLLGDGAKLERALIHFMLSLHTEEHGYLEMLPPLLVRGETLRGTGQLPKFEQDLFKTHRHDPEDDGALYLIPTAEVPLTGFHMNEILAAGELPKAYTAFTPCFRSEAGSHGRDVRGLIRQHQFNKVELMRFVTPESGEEQLELLTRHAEAVLQRLGLHYRVVELCAGDIGFSSRKTYDLEVWLPSQNAYREISSCSWFGDFQARRGKTRFRREPKAKPELVHTLNGSGLAVGRTLVALLEQGQQADGSVVLPEALRSLMGKTKLSLPAAS